MTSPSIRVAQHAGVCFGVKRALEEASKVLAEQDGSIHTLGELIHNPRVVQDLEQQGAHVAHSVDEVKDGTLIIRAHGVAPQVKQAAEDAGLHVVDATCPLSSACKTMRDRFMETVTKLSSWARQVIPKSKGFLAAPMARLALSIPPNRLNYLIFPRV